MTIEVRGDEAELNGVLRWPLVGHGPPGSPQLRRRSPLGVEMCVISVMDWITRASYHTYTVVRELISPPPILHRHCPHIASHRQSLLPLRVVGMYCNHMPTHVSCCSVIREMVACRQEEEERAITLSYSGRDSLRRLPPHPSANSHSHNNSI